MEATEAFYEKAAVGFVIDRTGWDYARADAWLALQVEQGTVQPIFGLLIGGTASAVQARWLRQYSRAELEQALTSVAMQSPAGDPARCRRPDGLESWYVTEHLPQGYSSREQDLVAARARFGRWTKDSADLPP